MACGKIELNCWGGGGYQLVEGMKSAEQTLCRDSTNSNEWGLAWLRMYIVCAQTGTNKVSCTIVRMYPNMSGMTEWKRLAGHIAWGVE